MDHDTSPAGHPQPKGTTAPPQLSCELCRKRKVKCDKLNPCTNCASMDTVCIPVYRTRLPRGRHVNRPRPAPSSPAIVSSTRTEQTAHPTVRNEDLHGRINRLEALIQGMRSTQTPLWEPSIPLTEARRSPSAAIGSSVSDHSAVPKRLTRQRPDQFWADLIKEVHGLRDVIGPSLGEEKVEDDQIRGTSSDSAKMPLPDIDGIRVLGLGLSDQTTASCSHLALQGPVVSSQLCKVYLEQVDPVMKILHRPSLRQWMVHGEPYMAYTEGHPSTEALGWAVRYSAISSMTQDQCSAMFHANKGDLRTQSRVACETAIGQAGLLSTADITVLQAFVLYLVSRRTEDRTPAVWTLVAVAVRIAKRLGLYLDPETETFFAQQMRRRLWFTICLMDLQTSFVQASEPLISIDESASTALPHHIDDSDFDSTTDSIDTPKEGLTDTTFALVTYHAQRMGRQLNFGRHDHQSEKSMPSTTVATPQTHSREQGEPHRQARCFEEEALRLLHFCDPETSAYAWFTWHGTQSLVATARLAALRPLQWPGAVPPPRREANPQLLRLCLPVLEKAQLMHTDPRAEGFRWYVTIPWHALAIAMAECYVSSDAALVQSAWPLVEASYLQHEATLGLSSGDPLGQLMRRTREKMVVTIPRLPVSLTSSTSPPGFFSLDQPQNSHDGRNPCDGAWPPPDQLVPSPLPSSTWEGISPSLEPASPVAVPPATAGGSDPGSETMWEELFSAIPFHELDGPDVFFFNMNRP